MFFYFLVKELDLKSISLAVLTMALPLTSLAGKLVYPENTIKSGDSLQVVSDELKLGLPAGNFKLSETKESLLGRHHYYQQVVNGVEVDGSEIVVSVNPNNEVIKVYNNGTSATLKSADAGIPLISETQALESAWKKLKVIGELSDAPKVQLMYSKDMNLVYKIGLSTTSPASHFNLVVNAKDGSVISHEDAALPRMKRATAPVRFAGKPAFQSFESANFSFQLQKAKKHLGLEELSFVNGSAQVFDPNPVVTLGRTDLQDTTPQSAFLQAYRNEELREITFAGGVYSLKGPKVTLIDFESPKVAPSTSTDGSWIFERKDPRFNDAMTYMHIDRSVRYIESLGFTTSRAVFKNSIEVDANGVNGQDNSHYIPSSRRLAFGNGCVDDNEDADVILHELGHAIQHHINPSWSGGDTGAMGEGFGDYWAATASLVADRGMEGNINWVFKWDGHNQCWPGRKLNTFTPTYNSARSYGAHAQVDGGLSDELWSTPIFQAFLELQASGASRGEIDKIILEAHFGLGSAVKMPDMARSIVRTAKALFPAKSYDQVYLRHFQKMKIL